MHRRLILLLAVSAVPVYAASQADETSERDNDEAYRYGQAICSEATLVHKLRAIKRKLDYAAGWQLDFHEEKQTYDAQWARLEELQQALQVEKDVPPIESFDYASGPIASVDTLIRQADDLARRIEDKLPQPLAEERCISRAGPGRTWSSMGERVRKDILFGATIEDFAQRRVRTAPELNGDMERASYLFGEADWRPFEPLRFDFLCVHPKNYRGDKLFPREGTYDPGPLKLVIDRIQERGKALTDIHLSSIGPSQWFLDKYQDMDLYFVGSEGQRPKGWVSGRLNIWNTHVMDYLRMYVREVAEYCRNDPRVALYELFNEPNIGRAGYSRDALVAFQSYLRKSFGTIARLNKLWTTSYGSFDEIQAPRDCEPRFEPAHDALVQSFQRFKCVSFVEHFRDLLGVVHAADPDRPVCSQFVYPPNLGVTLKERGVDLTALASIDWDLFGTHDWVGHEPGVRYLMSYSANRYGRKVQWTDEHIWSWGSPKEPDDERIVRAVAEMNVWRNIAWGKRGLIFFTIDTEWIDMQNRPWDNCLLMNVGGDYRDRIRTAVWDAHLRYPAGAIPAFRDVLRSMREAITGTDIANHRIAVLQPTTSLLMRSSGYVVDPTAVDARTDLATGICYMLLKRGIIPYITPEECVLDGREDLEDFDVVIVPGATWTPKGLEDKLLGWVDWGNTLLCVGPAGIRDEYGRERRTSLLARVFGEDTVKFSGTDYVLTRRIRTTYGQGTIVGVPRPQRDLNAIAHELEAVAEPLRLVRVTPAGSAEAVLRTDRTGARFVALTSLDTRRAREITLRVRGRFENVVDLACGLPPVPAHIDCGWTTVTVNLEPGEGTWLALGQPLD